MSNRFSALFFLLFVTSPVLLGTAARCQEDAYAARKAFVRSLSPLESGPGILVFEPVSEGDAALTAFGAGCGRWLHLVVGGHGELGKTPFWSTGERLQKQMSRSDLRLNLTQAASAANMTGVTHIAVGQIRGQAGRCTLHYQLYAVPSRKPVQAPVVVTGTRAQIITALPQMGKTLLARLKVKAPRVPATKGISADDMALLGGVPWVPRQQVSPTQVNALRALAARNIALANLLFLETTHGLDADPAKARAQRAWACAPDNLLVLGEIGHMDQQALLPAYGDVITAARKRFPRSYLLAHIETWKRRQQKQAKEKEEEVAEQAVRCAPRNPDAWLALGATISDAAQQVREGRVASRISREEWDFLHSAYAAWLAAVERASELDGRYGKAWLRVATAACFAGESELADRAFWKADGLEKGSPEVYFWGLEMYQPKWLDDRASLEKVARQAATDRYATSEQQLQVLYYLQELEFVDEANRLRAQVVAASDATLAAAPNDFQAHAYRANALKGGGKYQAALPNLQAMVRLQPTNAGAHVELGHALEHLGRLPEAIREHQEAIRLQPAMRTAHYRLCVALTSNAQYEAAVSAGKEATKYYPNNATVFQALAYACERAGKLEDCVQACRDAIRSNPRDTKSYLRLGRILLQMGEKQEGRAALERVRDLDTQGEIAKQAQQLLDKNP